MKKLTLAFVACSATMTASANLIPNGGFEVNTTFPGDFSGDVADGWSILSITPEVWDNTGTDGLAPGSSGYMPHVTAYEGSNWAALAANSTLQEGIGSPTMALGPGLYDLSLAMIYDAHNPSPYTNPGALDVFLKKGAGGYVYQGTLAANTGADQWEVRSLQLSITSADTYSIGLYVQTGPNVYLGIDDVNLVASPVPEPFTMGLAGLAFAAAARRRLRKSAEK
ncbi:MAG: PEP-CTERM sorting domain-containing protein [Chthonomonadaceae bacterium]|nr:PEP-CTERM sorting domain-containing protein [Chthonomonadaceae bacterium]